MGDKKRSKLGRSILVALAQRDKSRGWFAEQLGVSGPAVTGILQSQNPQYDTIAKSAAVFELTPSELMALGDKEYN